MTTRTRLRSVRAPMLLSCLLVLVAACESDDDSGAACRSACEVGCDAAEDCGLDMGTRRDRCVEDCTDALGSADCSETTPLDRLTCDELEHVFDCSAHCVAVCERALDCATFDEVTCRTGCALEPPTICNAASADARDCDYIKKEARFYEQIGLAVQSGDGFVGVQGSGSAYGLCNEADDCEAPLACALKTNTCGECETDAECTRGVVQALACQEGACVEVECTTDDHCSDSLCDTTTHTCGRCESDTDCTGFDAKTCDMATSTCVECVSNADCAGPSFAPGVCKVTESACVECVSNADCPSFLPRCNPETNACAACLRDEDCDAGLHCDTGIGVCI